MEKAKKRRIKKYVSWCCVAAFVALLAAAPLLSGSAPTEDGPQASILSGTVETGTISTVLRGGGTLAEEEAMEVSIPDGVKLTEFLVQNGEAVTAGQTIAGVDRVSVMGNITSVQETLDHLAEQMREVSDGTVSDRITAGAGGTVKAVYAQSGDSVRDVMLTHGALAVVSLDGKMAVDITARTHVRAGDAVTVEFSDGREVTGRIDSVLGFDAVVTIEDEGYTPGETVSIRNADGKTIGQGSLYVHNAWHAAGISGTVANVRVKPGDRVNAGSVLMTLTDTDYTAEFQALANQRREYEERMLELFRLYQDLTLTAPCDGIVAGVDSESIHMLRSNNEYALTLLANAPNGDDETIYHNFIGMVTGMEEGTWQIALDPRDVPITDYKILTGIEPDPAAMTQNVKYLPQAPIYTLSEDQWEQLAPGQIAVGDVLLFAGDDAGGFVWVVRLRAASNPEPPADPSEPTEPKEPSEPSEPSEPMQPEDDQGGFPFGGGQWPSGDSFFGGMQQEPEFQLHSLERATVATVTPQDTMTLTITLDERDIGKLSLGRSAQVRVEALKNEVFPATVTAIGTFGSNSGGSSKFTAQLTLEREDGMLAGMSATAQLLLSILEDVPTIPAAALTENGAASVVYTGYDAKTGQLLNPVEITTGVSDGETVQLLSGLEPGQTFYYAYYDTLELSHTPEEDLFPFD